MKEISFEISVPKIKLSGQWREKLKIVLSLLIVVGAFVAQQNFDFTPVGTLILAYFGVALLWNLTSQIAAGLALFFLASCPILLILKNDALAETFAIYAYYFLVITVVSEVIVLKRERPKNLTDFKKVSKWL